jgi:hypothetical protein
MGCELCYAGWRIGWNQIAQLRMRWREKVIQSDKNLPTRYDSPLLILLSANRARRRTLMITNSKSCILGQRVGLLITACYIVVHD